jgi:Xaa-Pro aminopeptidase
MNKIIAQTTALKIIARAWPVFLRQLRPGLTEKQVVKLLYQVLRAYGFSAWAFPTIVAAGANAAEPHHVPTNRIIKTREFIKIDFGVRYKGYCTDVTRTIVLGKPSALQRKLFRIVCTAQQRAVRLLRAGIETRLIDQTARASITRAGYGKYFIHSTGHGVSQTIHARPFLSPNPRRNAILKVGDVVTIEPGIYIPDKLGIRIEDMYVVTRTGSRCLSATISITLTP